ncbi:hypothetical protein [Synechococcus sp. MU1642]|uniref:hypothetical protein n=1 Tax=Synechococcus sp. MU1642 TaxID=2508348 RepID=UPI001CF8A678|nr:hypothetical protein [Synechococcus sp. MU1642]
MAQPVHPPPQLPAAPKLSLYLKTIPGGSKPGAHAVAVSLKSNELAQALRGRS